MHVSLLDSPETRHNHSFNQLSLLEKMTFSNEVKRANDEEQIK